MRVKKVEKKKHLKSFADVKWVIAYPHNKRLLKWRRIINHLENWRWWAHDMPAAKQKNDACEK